MPKPVLIRNSKTGEEYQVLLADFHRTKAYRKPGDPDAELQSYEDAGFKVVSYADGSEYEPPAPRDEPRAAESKKAD